MDKREILMVSNESCDYEGLHGEKFFHEYSTHSSYDSLNDENRKIGNFQFLNHINGAQRVANSIVFCLAVFGYLHLQFFGPTIALLS